MNRQISRRDFLKGSLLGLGGLLVTPTQAQNFLTSLPAAITFPKGKLGRVTRGKIDVKARPNLDSATTKVLYEDNVVQWIAERIGEPNIYRGNSRRWVETPEGYIYSPDLQPVFNYLNEPLKELPAQNGVKGMWAEVTVPLTQGILANPPAKSELLKQHGTSPFYLYYSQVFWVDEIRLVDGTAQYRVIEKHGSPGDIFWADATAFKPILEADFKPINPGVEDKRVVINLTHQTLSCYEGKREVYYCRISSGAKFDAAGKAVDSWSTPVGLYHAISRKFASLHMANGTRASGYELFGVSWTSIFASGGVAIHSTYWHNNYGMPMSHGCVNATPEDARWIFLWSQPVVPYDPGKIEITTYDGTKVQVIEA